VDVIRKVNAHENIGGGRIQRHIVRRVVKELRAAVSLNVVTVVVTPPKLNVERKLRRRCIIIRLVLIAQQARLRDLPAIRRKEKNVRTRRVHFVRFPRVDRFFLDGFDFKAVESVVEDLSHVHDEILVDLLPKMRSDNLDQGNFQRGDLAVHEDSG